MDKVKVFHLIKALGRGGAEVLLCEGFAVADRNNFDFCYGYLQTKPDNVAQELRSLGATVECFQLDSNFNILLGAFKIAKYLRKEKIQIVHAHLPMAGIVARLAGLIAKVPVVYTEHSSFPKYHPYVKLLSRLTWHWQKFVIAISDDVEESIKTVVGSSVPVKRILNGVNLNKFTLGAESPHQIRQQIGIPVDVPLIGTVAVFRPEKRLDLWIDTAKLILGSVPEAQFLLVGDGALRNSLESKCKSLGLDNVVHFVGRQSDVRPYLASMDVFLMSSAYEGLPIAPLEAMAMDLTVVATDVKGVRNVVESGKTGLLGAFDENVAKTLAALVVSLLRDPERRQELAVAGRKAAEEKFSIERMQRELEEVYVQVLKSTKEHCPKTGG